MNNSLFRKLEAAGGAVVFATASFLHFFYNITNGSVLGALLGSVNESVWEHLKIFAIAYIVWAITELLWARPALKPFIWAKAVGVYFLCFSIAGFFYLYTSITGKPILLADLLSSVILSFLAHLISCKITTSERNKGEFYLTGIMMLFLLFIMILCFTFYPVRSKLFLDPVTQTYGVQATPALHSL